MAFQPARNTVVGAVALLCIVSLPTRMGVASGQVTLGFTGAAFHLLLHRAPTAAEAQKVAKLFGKGIQRASVAGTITVGREYRGDQVKSWYQSYLSRAATAGEVRSGVAKLAAAGSNDSVQASILGSNEYFRKVCGKNTKNFARQLVASVLGRPATSQEIQRILSLLKAGSTRSSVALGVLSSSESQTDSVDALYAQLLQRAPTSTELSAGLTTVTQAHGAELLAAQLVGSDEFEQDAVAGWVTAITQALLNRAPSTQELSTDIGLLIQGAPPASITGPMLVSAEYRSQVVSAQFLHLLQRPATTPELAFYASYLASGGSDESLKSILIGSDEYYANRASSSDAGFIVATYADLLDRAPSQSEVQQAESRLTGGVSRTEFAYGVATSDEAYAVLLSGWCQAFLGRSPTAAELALWLSRFDTGNTSDEGVLGTILTSDEYFNHL